MILLATCESALDVLRGSGDPDGELLREIERVIDRTRAELSSAG
jgi:hypothetical protein